MKEYEKDGYLIQEYPSGAIIKSIIPDNVEPIEQPKVVTTEERLLNIENTLDLILLKQEGLL